MTSHKNIHVLYNHPSPNWDGTTQPARARIEQGQDEYNQTLIPQQPYHDRVHVSK